MYECRSYGSTVGLMSLIIEYKRKPKESQWSLVLGWLYLLGAKFHEAVGFETVEDTKHTFLLVLPQLY